MAQDSEEDLEASEDGGRDRGAADADVERACTTKGDLLSSLTLPMFIDNLRSSIGVGLL